MVTIPQSKNILKKFTHHYRQTQKNLHTTIDKLNLSILFLVIALFSSAMSGLRSTLIK